MKIKIQVNLRYFIGILLILSTHFLYLFRTKGASEQHILILYMMTQILFFFELGKDNFEKIKSYLKQQFSLSFNSNLVPLILIVITLISRLIFLKGYPFVSVWDPVRDGGLLAQEVALGINHDLFGNGPYNGWGRVLLGLTSNFYHIFGASVYTYRVPGALISILDIIVFYFFAHLVFKKRPLSILATLILICNTQHIYFSREEILILLNSFFCTLILSHLYLAQKSKNLSDWCLLALILGLAFNFHVSLWPLILLTLMVIFIEQVKFIYNIKGSFCAKQGFICIFSIIMFFFIGLGPRIYNLNRAVISQHSGINYKIPLFNSFIHEPFTNSQIENKLSDRLISLSQKIFKEIKDVWINYKKTLMVYFYENAKEHTKDETPLLPFVFGFFFILGLYHIFFISLVPFYKILGIFSLILPLTNSAITDLVNFDHRLFILVPFAVIISCIGMEQVLTHFTSKNKIQFFYILMVIIILVPAFDFFINTRSHKKYTTYDFLAMHAIYIIQDDLKKNINQQKFCLRMGEKLFAHMSMPHMTDFLNYFLYPLKYQISLDDSLNDNILQITKNCDDRWRIKWSIKICDPFDKWLCPSDYPRKSLMVEIDEKLSSLSSKN